jgi:hypothetical protein
MSSHVYKDSQSAEHTSDSLAAVTQTATPQVTICVHDGLEVVTRVEHESDGSVVINIYDRFREHSAHLMQPQTPPRAPARVIRRVGHLHNPRPSGVIALPQRVNPFQTPRASAIVSAQQRMRRARSARALPRSARTWNLCDAAGPNADSEPPTPPPTYQEAVFGRQDETLVSRTQVSLPHYAARDIFGGIFGIVGDNAHNIAIARMIASYGEGLPVYPVNEHGTSSDDSVPNGSPVSLLAEPHQFPMSSSPVSPLTEQRPLRNYDNLSPVNAFGILELEAIEAVPIVSDTPRIEGRQPDGSDVFADIDI